MCPTHKHILVHQYMQSLGAIFTSSSKAQLWTPQLELELFGKPTSPTCYLKAYFGISSLLIELNLSMEKIAGLFGSECNKQYLDLLICSCELIQLITWYNLACSLFINLYKPYFFFYFLFKACCELMIPL